MPSLRPCPTITNPLVVLSIKLTVENLKHSIVRPACK
jgi:hypothetical protein